MKKNLTILLVMFLAVLLVSACGSDEGGDGGSPANPDVVFTAAAQTLEARRQETANPVFLSTPTPSDTPTPIPQTPQALTPSPGVPGEPGDSPPAAGEGDQVEFVEDLSIPDGTRIRPGTTFVKTWRLRNIGQTTWTTAYALVYIGGDRMESPEAVPLPLAVLPGETVDLAVSFKAPELPGAYISYWQLRNAAGEVFGVGDAHDQPWWVDIEVSESAPLLATVTNTSAPNAISKVFLIVDSATANVCPHTYKFTGQITLRGPATLTYRLEAGSNQPGYQISLPDPFTAALPAGTHNIEYELDFTTAFNGWAQLHVIAPNDVISNRINLILTCP